MLVDVASPPNGENRLRIVRIAHDAVVRQVTRQSHVSRKLIQFVEFFCEFSAVESPIENGYMATRLLAAH